MKTNQEILQEWLDNRLLKTCVECQFSKLENRQYEDDFFQDLCLIILTYPNDKLNDAYNKHPNAFITRCIQNNIFSINSPYYKTYMRYTNSKYGVPLDEDDDNNDDTFYEYED